MSVAVRYVAAPVASRPAVTFSVSSIPAGGTVTVEGNSPGGWVFCGLLEHGCGDFLRVTGGTAEAVDGFFSGDAGEVRFALTHDGISSEVVVEYCTRAD